MELNAPDAASVPGTEPPRLAWHQKLGVLVFVLLCLEVGVFLLVFPWLQAWDVSWFAGLSPRMRDLWLSPFFRGALSGLGLLNIYISLGEIGRLRR
ncbi:MAG: hypothetical protein ABSF98_13350 [Bryobacteraceae bacterium]